MRVLLTTSLVVFGVLLLIPSTQAYQVADGDLGSEDFDDGDLGPFANRLEPPGFALGFADWIVRPGEQHLWANGVFGSKDLSGPGFTKSVTNHPLSSEGSAGPRDFSVAFRVQIQLPDNFNSDAGDHCLLFVTMRSVEFNGTGWQFIIDSQGRVRVYRHRGSGVYQPEFDENDPLSDLNDPAIAESPAGIIDVDNPTDQYARFWIEGEFGAVRLRAKAWKGQPEDEPDETVFDILDELPEPEPLENRLGPIPFSGTAGVDFVIDYEPPLTLDTASTTTVGTIIDDFAAFSIGTPVADWMLR